MIVLTRLNGPSFALNPDLIERVEANPDTVVVLIGGARYPIAESVEQLLERVRDYRGQVIASAHAAELAPSDVASAEVPPASERVLRILPTLSSE